MDKSALNAKFEASTEISKFIKMYGVVNRPLPRFVIIDKDGKIANYDAPTAADIALKNEITSMLNVK